MSYQYEYLASRELKKKEFRVIKIIFTLVYLGFLLYAGRKYLIGDNSMAIFFIIVFVLGLLSPLTYLNILGDKSPLNHYIRVDNTHLSYRLGIFPGKKVSLSEIDRIGYSDELLAIKRKSGESITVPVKNVFSKEKKKELSSWVDQFQKELDRK